MFEGEGYLPYILAHGSDADVAAVLNRGLDSFLLGEHPGKMYKSVGADTDALNEALRNGDALPPPSCGCTEATRYVTFLQFLTMIRNFLGPCPAGSWLSFTYVKFSPGLYLTELT
jgi:hypothetical protein